MGDAIAAGAEANTCKSPQERQMGFLLISIEPKKKIPARKELENFRNSKKKVFRAWRNSGTLCQLIHLRERHAFATDRHSSSQHVLPAVVSQRFLPDFVVGHQLTQVAPEPR